MSADAGDSAVPRILAIATTDVRIRIARGSSAVLLVALCIFAYVVVPDLSTGRALMIVNGHRALYNSATIALATSSLCAVLLGLAGYYLISTTVRRDVDTRTGFVIASTPVRNAEYLAGKLIGNIVFLSLNVLVYMINVMATQLLRGEAPLEPLTFALMFAAVIGPVVIVVSGLALMFECVRPLSGRIGDVLYFFLWVMLLSVPASTADSTYAGGIASSFDVFGMAFMINAAKGQAAGDFHAHPEISIGSSHFDPAMSPWTFSGLEWTAPAVAARATSALLVVPALLIAWLAFARFDPARIKGGAGAARSGVRGRISAPLRRVLDTLHPASWAGRGLLRTTLGEIALTIMLRPAVFVAAVAACVAGALVPAAALRTTLLPLIFVALIVTLAEIPTRDRIARVDGIRGGIAGDQELSIYAKLLGALGIALAFLAVPLARLAVVSPASALSLAIGAEFFASAAVSLGTLARTPKLFASIALLFLYVVMSTPGAAELDFAGWNGAASGGVRLAYFLVAMLLSALAALGDWRTSRADR